MDQTLKILHIEDSQADFLLIERHLRQQGLNARCTRVDSMAGLAHALADEEWDLTLSDFSIPALDFYDSFSRIQASAPDLPVILVSGSIGEEQAVEILKLGVWDFILKDNLKRLVAAIERSLVESQERTLRKAAESAMRESEYRFRSMFDNAPIAITIGRINDGRLSDVNKAWLQMFGFERDEAIGRTISELNLYIRSNEREDLIQRIQQSGQIVNRNVQLRRKNSEILDVLYSAELIVLNGELYLQAMMSDITERHILEDKLRQSQKMDAAGQLAGGIAHDFNNILQVITGNAQLQLMDNEKHGVGGRYLAEISKAVDRGASLTRSLLVFCRQQPMELKTFNLNDLIKETHKLTTRLVTEEIFINLKLCDQKLDIIGDTSLIQSVLFNLVTNARDAISNHGSITILTKEELLTGEFIAAHNGTSPEGKFAVLIVSDNGCGMDDTIKTKIFEPFFTTKEVGKGTGLGLSMVYGTIQHMGGFINANSEVGIGTTFEIYLPLTNTMKAVDDTIEKRKIASGNGELILIIEDEEGVRSSFAHILTIYGYQVMCSHCAEEGIKLAEKYESKLKLVIMDMVLPDMNGLETAGELARFAPDLPILFVTGYADKKFNQQKTNTCILRKPVHPLELLQQVDTLLKKSLVEKGTANNGKNPDS
jgi:PAS domain S-box-containing protein